MPEDFEKIAPKPSATVVLLRDTGGRPEVLLLRKSEKLETHAGSWVFPGGRVDDVDREGAADVLASARRAAARELHEEAGLAMRGEAFVPISRWITPPVMAKRFDTWFFIARGGVEDVRVDGQEIDLHRWLTPDEALSAFRGGEIRLPPPTFVTLTTLAGYASVADALGAFEGREPEQFIPRIEKFDGGACSLYAGDAAYESGGIDRAGPRHRLWFLEDGWRYERDL